MFYSNVKLQFQSDMHTSKDFVGSSAEANSLASSGVNGNVLAVHQSNSEMKVNPIKFNID